MQKDDKSHFNKTSMKWQILTLLGVIAVACGEKYTSRYDNMNVQEIIDNTKLLHAYLDCMLDKGKCTAEGKEAKIHVREALQTGCEKCTDKQKDSARLIIKHVMAHELQYWAELKAKYDPKDEFKHIYEAFLAAKD